MQNEHVGPTNFVQTEQKDLSLSQYTPNLNPRDNTARDGPITEKQYSGFELEGQLKTARGSPQKILTSVCSALNYINFTNVQTRA